jgi:hypothetical protein
LKFFGAFERSVMVAIHNDNEIVAIGFSVVKVFDVAFVNGVKVAANDDCFFQLIEI